MKLFFDSEYFSNSNIIKVANINYSLGIPYKTIKRYKIEEDFVQHEIRDISYYFDLFSRFINTLELENKIVLSIMQDGTVIGDLKFTINFSEMFLDAPSLPNEQFQVHFKSYNYPKVAIFSFKKTSSEQQCKLLKIALSNILFLDKHKNGDTNV